MYKFNAILKQTLWGGDRIVAFKHVSARMRHVGESWELSGVKGFETVVSEGPEAGKTVNELVRDHGARLLGRDNYQRFGNEFPLLVKFIDANQDLSIQVHPDDETARRQGYAHGKTEMWYVMDAAPDARLYNGLRRRITPDEYRELVRQGTICDALAQYTVSEGDCFFIPGGRIHAIGSGCFVAEIQQTSDITYRIYDYGRRDKNGNCRQLHTRQAAESIDYTVQADYRTYYQPLQDEGAQLVSCPYFTTAVYDLDDPMTLDYSELDSFVILTGLRGSCELTDDQGQRLLFREGETVLIPASVSILKVEGTMKFLETYI